MTDITLRGGSKLGSALMDILMADDIQPGSEPSYQTCKTLYASHPLGGKMVDSPLSMAQSEAREITVQDAPDEVLKAYHDQWEADSSDDSIANTTRLSRMYGIASEVLGCKGVPSDQPLDMTKIWNKEIFFNQLDPLNTAGSLVLNQVSTAPDFNKPIIVRTSGETYHASRFRVVMNEAPVFLEYTQSAFGFVGRSVYQRALYPLKSFIRSMIADDMIATKLGLIVAKQKAPGSVIDSIMAGVAAVKRALLREAQTGQVLSIDKDEEIETLDMQNVDGAGAYSRGNILKNIATAADMPAVFLENETLTEGFGEGTEDAKVIARYVDGIRKRMKKLYAFHDMVVQYRAWNPEFYRRLQRKYSQFDGISYEQAFSDWRLNFAAEWPSLLKEPESEEIKVEDVKFQALIAMVQTLMQELDTGNRMRLFQWAADTIGDNKLLFPHELVLDWDELEAHLEEQEANREEERQAALSGGENGIAGKMGRFDSVARSRAVLSKLNESVARLADRRPGKALTHAR